VPEDSNSSEGRAWSWDRGGSGWLFGTSCALRGWPQNPRISITEIQYPRAGNRTEESHSEVSSSSQQPQTDCIVRESIFRPDGRLPDRNGLLLQPSLLHETETVLFLRKSFYPNDEDQRRREKEFL